MSKLCCSLKHNKMGTSYILLLDIFNRSKFYSEFQSKEFLIFGKHLQTPSYIILILLPFAKHCRHIKKYLFKEEQNKVMKYQELMDV